MKNIFFVFLSFLLCVSCSKESEENHITPGQEIAKTAGMEYGPMSCTLEDGSCGSKCGNNSAGCWTTTKCKKNEDKSQIIMDLLFTPEQQDSLAHNNVPITDERLLQALKEDGTLPLR